MEARLTATENEYRLKVLLLLLDKYEKSRSFRTGTPGKKRPQFALADSPLAADYFDEMDYRKRERINQALVELAREGIVEVKWAGFQEGRQAEKVYLNPSAVAAAYAAAGVVPKAERMDRLRQIIAPLANHPWEWVRNWWAEADAALAERREADLDLEAADDYAGLVRVLLVLPELEDSVSKRVFSQQVLGDSKAFEQQVEKRLLALLKRYGPEEFDTDEEYLDSVGLTDNPKLVLVAGHLVLRSSSALIPLQDLPGGVGLSSPTVRQVEIAAVPARWVLLVENLACYHGVVEGSYRFSPEREGSDSPRSNAGLVIYTGGFPHRGVQCFLSKLKAFVAYAGRAVPVYHWGDLDYGGIRIFEYIRRNFFPNLLPYRMDVATYEKYAASGIPFGSGYAARLERLLSDPAYADWHPLISALLKHRRWVEQEALLARG